MDHTSGRNYYYTLKTLVNGGENIKAGCYAVTDGLKSDKDCFSMAMDVKVAATVVPDPSKEGEQCENCISKKCRWRATNLSQVGSIPIKDYAPQGCARIQVC